MRKIFSVLFALVLVLSLTLVTAVPVTAATLNVPSGYSTIQAAVNAATSGDTINVAAGTYNEALVIDKSLTIQGAGKADTIIDAGGAQHGIKIQTDPLNYLAVKDLTIQNAWSRNIYFYSNAIEVVIENVDLSCSDPTYDHYAGFEVHQKTVNTLLVKGCTFENIKRFGVRVDSGGKVGHLTVIDSDFSTDEEALIIDGIPSQAGIESCGNIGDLTVSGSTFTGLVSGIRLFWFWTKVYSIDSVNIEDSTFEGTDAGFFFYIKDVEATYEIGDDIDVHGCSFMNNDWGVKFSAPEKYADVVIDATDNWWGATNGPYHPTTNPYGLGDEVSDNVLFVPWFLSPIGTSPGPVGLNANTPQIIAISVTPTSIDFGNLRPGQSSAVTTLTIRNIGTVNVKVTTLITGTETGVAFFTANLYLSYPIKAIEYTASLAVGELPATPGAQVVVLPTYPAVGAVTGTLIFWAAGLP